MKLRAFVLALSIMPVALADTPPSRWDVAKKPQIAKDWEAHLEAQRWLAEAEAQQRVARLARRRGIMAPHFEDLVTVDLERARGVLEEVHARTSTDVRLRFDYGLVLQKLGHNVDAAAVLKDALAIAPTHPGAVSGPHPAWLNYSFANAYLENPEEERRGYENFLAHETQGPERLVPMLNLAEAEMHLGNLSEAVEGYRATKQLAASLPNDISMDEGILATWGLAVALDRAGDFGAAAQAAQSLVSMDPPPDSSRDLLLVREHLPPTYSVVPGVVIRPTIILDQSTVFFVPAYERKWYLALGETQLAKSASAPAVALFHWRAVERFWQDYVVSAKAHKGGDRFLLSAEKRLEGATKKRQELEKRVGPMKVPSIGKSIFIE